MRLSYAWLARRGDEPGDPYCVEQREESNVDVFTHINELRIEGWQVYRSLVLMCPRVVLWSPSFAFLDSIQGTAGVPTSEEVLQHIEQGHVQVMARPWWLENGTERKTHRWDHARRWTDADEQLRAYWRDDEQRARTIADARVRVMEESD